MLGLYKTANNVRVTLHTAINTVASSIVVDAASGVFQNPADPSGDAPSGGVGIATLIDSLATPTKTEIVTYTSLTDNGDGTLTLGGVTRAREGTTAQSFAVGAIVMQTMTAGQLTHPYITADQSAATLGLNVPTTITGSLAQQDGATSGWRALLLAGALTIAKYSSGFKSRWKIGPVNSETGSGNAGSDLAITPFSDAGGSLGNAVTIQRSNGNVGIGTTPSASRKLAVNGDIIGANVVSGNGSYLGCFFSGTPGDFDAFKITTAGFAGSLTAIIMSVSADGATYHTAFSIAPGTGQVNMSAASATTLTFTTANGGTINLGTQPATPPVSGGFFNLSDTSDGAAAGVTRVSADAVGPIIVLGKARGSAATPALVADNDVIGSIDFYSATTASAWKKSASIRVEADGFQSSSSVPTAMVFEVTIVSESAPVEVLRIDSLTNVTFSGSVTANAVTAANFTASSFQSDFGPGWKTDAIDERGSVVSQTAPTTTVNNVALASTTRVIRLTSTGGGTWTGLVAGGANRVVTIFNAATSAVTLSHENASSTAANRFTLPGNANYAIAANDSVSLWYDSSSARWRIMK